MARGWRRGAAPQTLRHCYNDGAALGIQQASDSRAAYRIPSFQTMIQPATFQLPQLDEAIRLRGVRVHNLKNVSLDLPREQLVVLTGPSGSGKSSLAFDTIYAEGQRQYIESLSAYARQFLQQMERPDVDLIEGLEPTIAIDQRSGSHNPRSTVATVTEDLRLAAAADGPAGRAALLPMRRGDPSANARTDSRRNPAAARRRQGHAAGAAGSRPARPPRRRLPANPQGRLGPGSGRRRGIRSGRLARTLAAEEPRYRRGGRPCGDSPGKLGPHRRVHRARLAVVRGVGRRHVSRCRTRRQWSLAGSLVQHAVRMSQLRFELRRVGAADVQFQQPSRRVSHVRGFGGSVPIRPRTCGAGSQLVAFHRRHRALARRQTRGRTPAPGADRRVRLPGGFSLEHAAGQVEAQDTEATPARRRRRIPWRVGHAAGGTRRRQARFRARAVGGRARGGSVSGLRRRAAASRSDGGDGGRQGDSRDHGAQRRTGRRVLRGVGVSRAASSRGRADCAGDRRPDRLFAKGRSRLLDARPGGPNPQWRRIATRAVGRRHRVGARRRVLCAR